MTKKNTLSTVVDQLGDLLSQIQDNQNFIVTDKPIFETLAALEQQIKIFREFTRDLPKGEPSPEDKKPLEKLERVTSDAKRYQKALDKGLEKAKKEGKIKESEKDKKRTAKKRKKKFDSLGKL